jgi:hypothetical protein
MAGIGKVIQGLLAEVKDVATAIWRAPHEEPRRRSSSSSGGGGGDELSLDMEMLPRYATQEDANAAFVHEYKLFIERHHGRPVAYRSDLYCCMGLGGDAQQLWWMAPKHPVAIMLRNSRVSPVYELSGHLLAFNNHEVADCVLEIAEWFAVAECELSNGLKENE